MRQRERHVRPRPSSTSTPTSDKLVPPVAPMVALLLMEHPCLFVGVDGGVVAWNVEDMITVSRQVIAKLPFHEVSARKKHLLSFHGSLKHMCATHSNSSEGISPSQSWPGSETSPEARVQCRLTSAASVAPAAAFRGCWTVHRQRRVWRRV